jgi:hypothetical protein
MTVSSTFVLNFLFKLMFKSELYVCGVFPKYIILTAYQKYTPCCCMREYYLLVCMPSNGILYGY